MKADATEQSKIVVKIVKCAFIHNCPWNTPDESIKFPWITYKAKTSVNLIIDDEIKSIPTNIGKKV